MAGDDRRRRRRRDRRKDRGRVAQDAAFGELLQRRAGGRSAIAGITTRGVAASMTTRRTFTSGRIQRTYTDRTACPAGLHSCGCVAAARRRASLMRRRVLRQAPSVLRWGGDAEGGAPFVEADPADPQKLVGFDVEIAELIARELGRRPEFVQVAFTSLDQSAARGDFDIGLSGIEDTPARRAGAGRERAVLPLHRAADGARCRSRSLPHARRSARPPRRARSAAPSPTNCCSPPSASTASSPCRTTTTCIRTRIR